MDNLAGNILEYGHRGAIAKTSVGSGSGGGGVDDIFRRLGNVETGVSELRSEVSAISATIPHLATAASVADVRTEIASVRTEIAGVRTEIAGVRTEIKTEIADVKTLIASKETVMIRWFIGTALTLAGVAFSLAKFVH